MIRAHEFKNTLKHKVY